MRGLCDAQDKGLCDRYITALRRHGQNLNELNDPSKYYITHELGSELKGLDQEFDILRHNEQTFQDCKNWRDLFRGRDLYTHREEVMEPLKMDRDRDLVGQLKRNLELERTKKMEGVDLAALHHVAKENLVGYRNQLLPNARTADLQLSQFGEWVGATSQFNRHRAVLDNGHKWRMEVNEPAGSYRKPHCSIRKVTRWNLPRSFDYAKEIGLELQEIERPSQMWRQQRRKIDYSVWRSPTELMGVITKPHVSTETKDRFRRPVRPNEPIECINPAPDFSVLGKFAKEPKPEPRVSEYQYRYLWPDGTQICTKPWARDKEVMSPRENKSKYGWERRL